MAKKRSGKKSKKSGWKLTFYSNRNTPRVTRVGTKAKKKKGEGKVVKTRRATKAEAKQINKGKWLRVDSKGNKAGSKSYKGKRSRGRGPSKAASRKAVSRRKKR